MINDGRRSLRPSVMAEAVVAALKTNGRMTTVLCATDHEFYEDQKPLNFGLFFKRIFRKPFCVAFSILNSLVFTVSKVVSCDDAMEKPGLRVVPSDL